MRGSNGNLGAIFPTHLLPNAPGPVAAAAAPWPGAQVAADALLPAGDPWPGAAAAAAAADMPGTSASSDPRNLAALESAPSGVVALTEAGTATNESRLLIVNYWVKLENN